MDLKPLADRVVIREIEEPVVSHGGIYLPDMAKEKPTRGTVVAVGPGRVLDDGSRGPMPVTVGDMVLFSRWAGNQSKSPEWEGVRVMSVDEVIGVIEK